MNNYERYKNSPEGSRELQIYEYYSLPFEAYLKKYFTAPDLTGWNIYLEWAKAADPKNEEFIRKWCGGKKEAFDFDLFVAAKKELMSRTFLSEDLSIVFALMAGTGMFTDVDTILGWTQSKDWLSDPQPCAENCYSILELIGMERGENYIKANISRLSFWKLRG